MKKALTVALALAGLAGLVSAVEIDTAPAGYIEKAGTGSSVWVCNPFGTFTNAAPKLGDVAVLDFDSATDYIKVFSSSGSLIFRATYLTAAEAETAGFGTEAGWYTYGSNLLTNNFALARGNAIQYFGATSSSTLVFAGSLVSDATTLAMDKAAQNWVGNTRPLATTVGAVVPSSAFAVGIDYAKFANPATGKLTKATYLTAAQSAQVSGAGAGWYLWTNFYNEDYSAAALINDWPLAPGQGFLVRTSAIGVTITVPGL